MANSGATETLKQGAQYVASGASNLASTASQALENISAPIVPTEPDPTKRNQGLGVDRQDVAIRAGAESAAVLPEAAPITPAATVQAEQDRAEYAKLQHAMGLNDSSRPQVPRDTVESTGAADVSYEHRPKTLPKSQIEEREKERGQRHEELGVERPVIESRIKARWAPEATGNAEAVNEKSEMERELLDKVPETRPNAEAIAIGSSTASVTPAQPHGVEEVGNWSSETKTEAAKDVRAADRSSSVQEIGNWPAERDIPRTASGGIANGTTGHGSQANIDIPTSLHGTPAPSTHRASDVSYPAPDSARRESEAMPQFGFEKRASVVGDMAHEPKYAGEDTSVGKQPTDEPRGSITTIPIPAAPIHKSVSGISPPAEADNKTKSSDFPPSKSTSQGDQSTRSPDAGRESDRPSADVSGEKQGSSKPATRENPSAIPTAGGEKPGEKHWGESKLLPENGVSDETKAKMDGEQEKEGKHDGVEHEGGEKKPSKLHQLEEKVKGKLHLGGKKE